MSENSYHGRHRARRRAFPSPHIIGGSLLLPVTATVAVFALTGSGASLADASLPASAVSAQDPEVADAAALSALKVTGGQILSRDLSDRAARDAERVRIDAVTAENERRAQTEAALAAGPQVLEVQATAPAAPVVAQAATQADPAATAATAGGQPLKAGSRAWVKPVSGSYVLTSGFAWRWGDFHQGQDLAMPTGTPLKALSSGRVVFAGYQSSYGYKVEIEYWDGTVSYYAHMSRIRTKVGATVAPGDVVGLSGNTGNSTGPHLHLEIHPAGGEAVAPLRWLAGRGVRL